MGNEIELISDGDGLAVIGESAAVERFLSSAGVQSKDLALQHRLGSTFSAGAGLAQAGSEVVVNAGRWVKLTEESAKAMKAGQLMKGSSGGVSRAVVTSSKGKITGLLEIVKPGSVGSVLTNPAMLAGAAGIMAQMAMQQSMEEITEYLAVIDEKVDDILRAQKDVALAEMTGVGLIIDEAMTVREHTGRVSNVTWSKVQGSSQTIAATQAYALRQLDALTEKLAGKSKVSDVAKISKDAGTTVEEWLAVLARCFQLQDALAVLELDRVLDSNPDELDRHRLGLKCARKKRREQIALSTGLLIERLDAVAARANMKVLLNPVKSGQVVRSGNEVAADILVFNERMGIGGGRESLTARRWREAAGEVVGNALETGADAAGTARRVGKKTLDGAKSTGERLSNGITQYLRRTGHEGRG